MTKQLSEMIEKVKTWPEWRQEDVALILQEMERQGTEIYHLSDEERAAVEEGLAQAERGEFVSDEEMEKFWKRWEV
ncbi:MAG TPA: hypothetical protein VJL57_00565 [Candidatus Paceibacterota bacterium]